MLSVDIGESNTLNERTLRMHAISHFPIENRKASMDCLSFALCFVGTKQSGRKLRARNYKRCLITSKKMPQKLFAVSVPCLMTGTLSHYPSKQSMHALRSQLGNG